MTGDVYVLIFRRMRTDPLDINPSHAVGGIVMRGIPVRICNEVCYVVDYDLAAELAISRFEILPDVERLDIMECHDDEFKDTARRLNYQWERETLEFEELMGV